MTENMTIEDLFELEKPAIKELLELAEDKDKLIAVFKSELMKKYNNPLINNISLSSSNLFSLLQNDTKTFLEIAKNHLLYDIDAVDYVELHDYRDIYEVVVHFKNKVWQEYTFDKKEKKLVNVRVYFYKYGEVVVLGNVQKFDKMEALTRIVEGVL